MDVKHIPGESIDLSEEDKKFYLENGYLVVKGVFTPEECETILNRLKNYEKKDGSAMMNMDREYQLSIYAQEKIAEEKGVEFEEVSVEELPFEDILETTKLLRDFMRDPRQISILRQLHEGYYEKRAGKSPLIWGGLMTQIIFKDPGTQYGHQAWNPHQDNSYVLNKNGLYVTTNTFFEDSDMNNGTMYIYPGSHKKGIIKFEEKRSFREEKGENPGNKAEIPEEWKKVDLEFKKGDVLVLNGDVVHGSYPNKSKDKSRPLYMNVYIPEGEYFRPGKESRKMFQPLS